MDKYSVSWTPSGIFVFSLPSVVFKPWAEKLDFLNGTKCICMCAHACVWNIKFLFFFFCLHLWYGFSVQKTHNHGTDSFMNRKKKEDTSELLSGKNFYQLWWQWLVVSCYCFFFVFVFCYFFLVFLLSFFCYFFAVVVVVSSLPNPYPKIDQFPHPHFLRPRSLHPFFHITC